MNWFPTSFIARSSVPITYDEEQIIENEFNQKIRVTQQIRIGYVFVDALLRFMQEMQKIQDEVKI